MGRKRIALTVVQKTVRQGHHVFSHCSLTGDHEKSSRRGGKVLGEPVEIPGVGQYVSFYDTEGNRASMLQPKRM